MSKEIAFRHLDWPNCYNVRDLGGLVTVDGRVTRTGQLIRADILSRLTDEGHYAMAGYGVRTVIDLRHPDEVAKYDYPELHSDITYHNLPLETFKPEVRERIKQAKSRGEVYCIILDHYPTLIARVMRTIAAADEGGVLFHCYAGKDRTGNIAALLLKLVGVPDDVIAADYAESQKRLRPVYEKLVARVGEENLGFWGQPTATEEMMMLLLRHVEERYGDVTNYLKQAGMSSAEIEKLSGRLV